MPKLVPITQEAFNDFTSKILEIKYAIITRKQIAQDFQRFGLIPPKSKNEGRQIGFQCTENGLVVVVWPTYLEEIKTQKKKGCGWVLIKDKYTDKAHYFAHPFRRTKKFLWRLLCYAWISQHKIKNRPRDSFENEFMILRQRESGAVYWRSKNKNSEGKYEITKWDFNIGPKALAFLKKHRKPRAKYKAKNKKAGIIRTPAKKIRNRWKITKPQNVL